MDRRQFFAGTCVLLGTGCAGAESLADDSTAVKQVIGRYYETFFRSRDEQQYRSLLTDDYRLLESGEILDVSADVATMPAADSGYKRTDAFDFRAVTISGDIAWAVYFLTSHIEDKKDGPLDREWLESAILRRAGGTWRIALLHSTRMTKLPTQ